MTKDAVKKGLKCCGNFPYQCDKCPFRAINYGRVTECQEKMHREAYRTIRTLERIIAAKAD